VYGAIDDVRQGLIVDFDLLTMPASAGTAQNRKSRTHNSRPASV